MRSKGKIFSSIITFSLVMVMIFCTATENTYAFSTFTGSSPYSGVAYSTYYHNKDKFNGNVILNGVDVSSYQSGKKTDWSKARNNGVDFAILRVTATGYGSEGNKFIDSDFASHYKKAKEAGLMVGVYVFSQAVTEAEARAEVDYAVNRLKALGIGPKDLNMPLYMDYEFSGGSSGRMSVAQSKGKFSKSKATSCAKAFCDRVKSYGYEPGIYANKSFLTSTIDGAMLGESYRIWTAQYYKMAEFTGAYDAWQYSSAAKIDGIYNSSGGKVSVDVNYWYLNPNRTSGLATDVANCTVSGDRVFAYTGKQIKPTFNVRIGSKTLESGKDYCVGYARNIKKGTAYAYIKGIGTYSGYKIIPFTITDKLPDIQDKEGTTVENLGIKDFVKQVEIVDETTEGSGEDSEGVTEEVAENEPEGSAEGSEGNPEEEANVPTEKKYEYIPLIALNPNAQAAGYVMSDIELCGVIRGTTAKGIKQAVQLDESCVDYSIHAISRIGEELPDSTVLKTGSLVDIRDAEGNRVASLRIVVNGSAKVSLTTSAYTYNGKEKKPGVTLVLGKLTAAQKRTSGNDYMSISYPSGRKLPGTYTVTVKGKGCFDGAFTAKFKISVATTSLKSVKRAGSRSFKAIWYKKSNTYVTGYQLQYSRHSNMSLDLIKTVKSYKTGSAKITKRYSGYKYYVRVRTYKTINGKKYYSAWSGKKTVKVK